MHLTVSGGNTYWCIFILAKRGQRKLIVGKYKLCSIQSVYDVSSPNYLKRANG